MRPPQAQAWMAAAVAYKRLPAGSPLVAEEWITGPYPVLTSAGALAASIKALEKGRSPVDGFSVRRAPGGRVAVRVLPHTLLDKPVTSELGGVSPSIVLPGGWSEADMRFQAEHIATQWLHYGGYNCAASQEVVVPSGWAQKDPFLAHLRAALSAAPARPAYCPGSDDRVSAALASYAGAERISGGRVLIGNSIRPHPARRRPPSNSPRS
ncbi:hypothetical protein AB0C98_29650 [Streptomyces sp. NPDC048558]|uniref:hypothetical protein n=1 Tax=Streptomyces sp. NPDC048558 TaxID=3155759 RepID=UPI00343079A5